MFNWSRLNEREGKGGWEGSGKEKEEENDRYDRVWENDKGCGSKN